MSGNPQGISIGRRLIRSPLVTVSFMLSGALHAQTPAVRPTPAKAQVLLQTRPHLAAGGAASTVAIIVALKR